jgi:hypothetical protein
MTMMMMMMMMMTTMGRVGPGRDGHGNYWRALSRATHGLRHRVRPEDASATWLDSLGLGTVDDTRQRELRGRPDSRERS